MSVLSCGVVGRERGVITTGGVPSGDMNSMGVPTVDGVLAAGDLLFRALGASSSSVSLVGMLRYPGIKRLLGGG